MSEGVLLGLMGFAGTVVGGLFVWLGSRSKNKADAAKVIQEASIELITPLRARVTELEPLVGRVRDLEEKEKQHAEELKKSQKLFERFRCVIRQYADRVIYLTNGNIKLSDQLRRYGHVPIWQPDEWLPPEVEDVE